MLVTKSKSFLIILGLYVGEICYGRRLNPRYPHTFWNVNTRVQDHLPRTNNNLEGWHNRFPQIFEQPHPHICTFIDILKQGCAINRHPMMQEIIGADLQQKKRMYRLVNDRLQNVVQNYNVENNIDFLRGIAQNLALFA